MQILAFMNQKGGVGKTTTAVNMAALLALEHGKRILAVDLDPQGNLSDHLGIDPNQTEASLYQVLMDRRPAREVIRRAHGFDIIPSNRDMPGIEMQLAQQPGHETRLKDALLPLAADYDLILIDCPPSLGTLTLLGLALAHEVIVPMQAEYLALRGLSQLVETLGIVRQRINHELDVSGVVFCMYDNRTNLARDVKAEVEAFFPGRVFATPVRKNVRLAEAPSHGLPVCLYDPACAGSEDYRAIVREFLDRSASVPRPQSRHPLWRADGE